MTSLVQTTLFVLLGMVENKFTLQFFFLSYFCFDRFSATVNNQGYHLKVHVNHAYLSFTMNIAAGDLLWNVSLSFGALQIRVKFLFPGLYWSVEVIRLLLKNNERGQQKRCLCWNTSARMVEIQFVLVIQYQICLGGMENEKKH